MADLSAYDLIYPLSAYIRITQIFWEKHRGVDFGWWSGYSNQNIIAIADGVVVDVVDGWGNTYPSKRIYGNYVIIDHGGGVYSLYGHLLQGVGGYVRKGQKVKQGAIIGRMGNSGFSCGQHLHFELRNGGNSKAYSINPVPWLVVRDRAIWINPASLQYAEIRTDFSVVEPVARDPYRDQIEITIDNLRCRKTPGLSGEILGLLSRGYYNYYGKYDADGYTWYKIGEDRYCAGVSVVELPAKTPELYDVQIYGVSTGDVAAVRRLCEELGLDIEVTPA